MVSDPNKHSSKRPDKQHRVDNAKRRREDEALDAALENTFPASDPVSIEQPSPPHKHPAADHGDKP